MKLVYTEQAFFSLNEIIEFNTFISSKKRALQIVNSVFDAAETLILNPYKGQVEFYLQHLGLEHRRIVVGHLKIIYRIENEVIYITDIFDTRQNPSKMKG